MLPAVHACNAGWAGVMEPEDHYIVACLPFATIMSDENDGDQPIHVATIQPMRLLPAEFEIFDLLFWLEAGNHIIN